MPVPRTARRSWRDLSGVAVLVVTICARPAALHAQILYGRAVGNVLSDVYVMRPDGSGDTRLTTHAASDGYARWSPDGRRIAFTSSRDDQREVYIMDADGRRKTNLTQHRLMDLEPSWSPDGECIAFTSWREPSFEVYVIDVAGGAVARLTHSEETSDWKPDWSPDGQTIVFQSNRDETKENIYAVDPTGADLTRLTKHAAGDIGPRWHPSGDSIAFLSFRDGPRRLFVMNLDGSDIRALPAPDHVGGYSWSPDGERLVYSLRSQVENTSAIYVMGADGSGRKLIKQGAPHASGPDWGPGPTTSPVAGGVAHTAWAALRMLMRPTSK